MYTSYGPPDVVRVTEVDEPAVRDNEVLVKVHATTVNRTDCGFRAGKPFFVRLLTGLPRPRVRVLGTEFAGTVAVEPWPGSRTARSVRQESSGSNT